MSSTSATITRNVDSKLPSRIDAPAFSYGDWIAYHFQALWSANPLGEHWSVRSPDGVDRFAHILPANDMELISTAVARLGALRHPNICTYEAGPICGGRLLLTTPQPPRTISDLYHRYARRGYSGIPRAELLDYWQIIAETLDGTAKEHQLFHLWLHPRLLFLDKHRVQIVGLGLPDLLLRPTQTSLANLNPRYGAPEINKRRPVSRCDQYSLAVMYAELVSGVHVFRSQKDRRDNRPDLSLLPDAERAAIQRAMNPDPRSRFPTCLDFVRELLSAQPEDDDPGIRPTAAVIAEAPFATNQHGPADVQMDHFVSELVLLAFGATNQETYKHIRYTLHPEHIEHHCVARLFPGAASLKLDGFRQQWKARPLLEESNRMVMQINLAVPLWKRLLGRRARLQIEIELFPADRNQLRNDVAVEIRPIGCSVGNSKEVLRKYGLEVLDSLRMFLQAQPDERDEERVSCIQPLRVRPVRNGVPANETIECMTKDISASGIGFFLPQNCEASSAYFNLPSATEIAEFAGLAQIVRMTPCADGWYEVGASFDMKRTDGG